MKIEIEVPTLRQFRQAYGWTAKTYITYYLGNIFGKVFRKWYYKKCSNKTLEMFWGLKTYISDNPKYSSNNSPITLQQFTNLVSACSDSPTSNKT